MEKTVTMPFGEVPGMVAANVQLLDAGIHCWDIAKATGQKVNLSHEVIAAIDNAVHQMITDNLRVPGMFGAEVKVSADADLLTRVVAFSGRNPS